MLFNLLMSGGAAAPVLQTKTGVDPSTSSQTIQPDSGYDGLSSVQINAMPAMTLPTAASSTGSGTNKATISPSTSTQYINIPTGYNASAARYTLSAMTAMTLPTSASSSSSGTSKATINPSESNQYINIPTGYNSAGAYYLIAAISNTYVGSGITRRSSSDLTANGLTVNAPSGYYQYAASKTLTDQNLIASNIKKNISIFGVTGNYEGEGGGGDTSLQVDYISGTASRAGHYVMFSGLQAEPTSFVVVYSGNIPTSSSPLVARVVFDGQSFHGQTITNTSNAQVSADTGFSMNYSNGELYVGADTAFFYPDDYPDYDYYLIYTYGGGSIGTKDVQVGSGATSISFTGLEDEPVMWSCIFKSNFSTSNGYQRVIGTEYFDGDITGMEMDSSAHFSNSHWTSSYSNGTLTITSQGTNAGGYFHQPGYYQLTYATSGETPPIEVEPLSVTENGTYQESGKAYSPVVVNVSGGGGSASIDTKTVTASNRPTSLSFSSMKGQPKAFVLRCTSSMSRSSSSSYYYVAMMRYNGTNTTGNCWRMSNGNWTNITSGYSFTYSNGTLTVTSSGTTTTSPGCFYNGDYELVYIY